MVDQHRDQRRRPLPIGGGGAGPGGHLDQRISPALPRRPHQIQHRRVATQPVLGVGPVRREQGLVQAAQFPIHDLPADGIQRPVPEPQPLERLRGMHRPLLALRRRLLLGVVRIRELTPVLDFADEPPERQPHRPTHQHRLVAVERLPPPPTPPPCRASPPPPDPDAGGVAPPATDTAASPPPNTATSPPPRRATPERRRTPPPAPPPQPPAATPPATGTAPHRPRPPHPARAPRPPPHADTRAHHHQPQHP
jgi:hypothetical protein